MRNNSVMKKTKANFLFILLLLGAMIIWGVSWSVAKVISGSSDASVIVFLRLFLAFLGLCGIILFNRIVFGKKTNLSINVKTFFSLALSALFLTVYNQLFFRGLETGFPGAGGVLVTTTTPLFTYLFWMVLFKKQPKTGAVIGLIAGLAGGLILLEVWQIGIDKLLKSGNLFFILASITWAFLTITSQKTQKHIHFFTYCFYLYGMAALFDLVFAIPGGILKVFQQDWLFWLCIFYLAVPTTAMATTVYFFASKKLGSHRASSFIFIVPCAALLSSFFIHGEVPSIFTLIGGAFAMAAVYMINRYKEQKEEKPDAAGGSVVQ